jgi:glycosyltransferase involved in cell wall biosynthesis
MPGVTPDAGAETSFLVTAPHLMARGVDLHLALLTPRQTLVPQLERQGVVIHDLSAHTTTLGRAVALRGMIGSLRPGLVHATLFEAAVPAQLAAAVTRVPVLVTWAATVRRPGSEGAIAPWKLRVVDTVEMAVGRLSRARFHAVTPGVAAVNSAGLHVPEDRVRVAERGRDPGRFAPLSQEERSGVRASLGLAPEDRVVLAVARQEPQKGHERLLDAVDRVVERVPGAVVLLVGREGSASPDLERRRGQLRHADRVRFLGHRDDVSALLQVADCIVCTSHREGAAGALIEAMAGGCPIVSVPIDGLAGILEDDVNAVVVEPADLADAIAGLLESPDRAARLAGAGRRTFDHRFTIERSAESLLSVYKWAAGRPTAPPASGEPPAPDRVAPAGGADPADPPALPGR